MSEKLQQLTQFNAVEFEKTFEKKLKKCLTNKKNCVKINESL